ncbi:MAG: hypothetical protein ABSB19_12380 [Methylomonas sp.]|jgi:hypothetical protein
MEQEQQEAAPFAQDWQRGIEGGEIWELKSLDYALSDSPPDFFYITAGIGIVKDLEKLQDGTPEQKREYIEQEQAMQVQVYNRDRLEGAELSKDPDFLEQREQKRGGFSMER